MFTNTNEKMKKNDTATTINTIGSGTTINGDITSKSDIRIDGVLKGSVVTEGKVVLGEAGVIEGDVSCKDADIAGTIKAKISVSQLLSLKSSSSLILTPSPRKFNKILTGFFVFLMNNFASWYTCW